MTSKYDLLYKVELPTTNPWPSDCTWDWFVSAYNSSERVSTVEQLVHANHKHWLLLPGYGYASANYPSGNCYDSTERNEADYIEDFLRNRLKNITSTDRICIDITGFVKPYAMFLLLRLFDFSFKKIDVLYSEPSAYSQMEHTKFSDEKIMEVRQVVGFEGVHTLVASNDLLIIGAGYDHESIKHVAKDKARARRLQMFGFPPLRPDMYQENVLSARRAADDVGIEWHSSENLLAPANDPFVTAAVLSEAVRRERLTKGVSNLYLCPLATEAQALGFTLFYLTECRNSATSMLYPFCDTYPPSTSVGTSRIWLFTLEIL